MIIQSLPKFQTPLSCVMAKLKVVTILIQKLSVKYFTFVEVMGMEV